jgi:hypothetical protein
MLGKYESIYFNTSMHFFVDMKPPFPSLGYLNLFKSSGGTQQRSWLRHYATSQKVMGSIPDEVMGFFN